MNDEKNNEGKSTNWAEKIEKEAANEKSNKAHGLKRGAIRDETAGSVKDLSQLKKEAAEQIGKTAVEKYVKDKTPQTRLLRVDEQKQIPIDNKDLHLKSTTTLTDPDTAKQNLKDASKAKNFGKETPPSRGGSSGRGGGFPMMREPDEIIKEKNDVINPEDILSQKDKKPAITPPQQEQKSQPQQAKHRSSFMASLDAKIQDQVSKQDKVQPEKSVVDKPVPKREGIIAKLEKKVEEVKKSAAEKTTPKEAKIEIAKSTPKPPIKSR